MFCCVYVSNCSPQPGPNTCLRCLVESNVYAIHEIVKGQIVEISLDQGEEAMVAHEIEIALFVRSRIVIGEGIDTDDLMMVTKQAIANVRSNETGAPCYYASHEVSTIIPSLVAGYTVRSRWSEVKSINGNTAFGTGRVLFFSGLLTFRR